MILKGLRWKRGQVRLRISGPSPERFFNMCQYHQIHLWDMEVIPNGYEVSMAARDVKKLKPIIRKTRTTIRVVRKSGLPFFLHRYRSRKMFFIGGILCVLMVYGATFFLWNIQIDGNRFRTDETLLSFLRQEGVYGGTPTARIDCDKLAQDIRNQYPDIIWVSVALRGSKLFVQIKENVELEVEQTESGNTLEIGKEKSSQEKPETEMEPEDLVATESGVVDSIVTSRGVPQVMAGDKVEKGQVLVSGNVPILDDGGGVVDYQYQASEADIQIRRTISYKDTISRRYEEKEKTGLTRYYAIIHWGKYGMNLPDWDRKKKNCWSWSTCQPVTITPALVLPLTYGYGKVQTYTPKERTYGKKMIQRLLSGRFYKYCRELKEKGVSIPENNVKIYVMKQQATAHGELTLISSCVKKIPAQPLTAQPAEKIDEQ